MLSFLAQFNHKAEIRESKDEMLLGEIVRAMARNGCPAIAFRAGDDRQRVRFKTIDDPLLHSVWITLDRKTGTGALSSALMGSKATLTVSVEVKNLVTDPDDLVDMYKTDLANLFKMPVLGGIKLNHELNSVYATTTVVIEIDDYVMGDEGGADRLAALLKQRIDTLSEKVRPYKR